MCSKALLTFLRGKKPYAQIKRIVRQLSLDKVRTTVEYGTHKLRPVRCRVLQHSGYPHSERQRIAWRFNCSMVRADARCPPVCWVAATAPCNRDLRFHDALAELAPLLDLAGTT